MSVLTGAVLLAFATSASAAMGIRLGVSTSTPRTGEEVSVWLFPYWPYADGSEEPAAVEYPFRVQALGPGGRNVIHQAVRTPNPYVWRADFVFRTQGRWEIRWVNAYQSDRAARLGLRYPPWAPRLSLHVSRKPVSRSRGA